MSEELSDFIETTETETLGDFQENANQIGGTSNYNDLTNKPQINSITLSGNKSLNDLGIINFSGNYNDLTNKPNIPNKTSDLTNDSGFINKEVNDLTNYTKTSDLGDLALKDKVNYNTDIENLPTIPTNSDFTLAGLGEKSYNNLTDKPDLSVYATNTNLTSEITNRESADTLLQNQINLKQDIIQYATLPTASSSLVGKIGQYVGTTTSDYTNGYFYKCVDTSTNESINVSQIDNGVSLGTINIDNNTFKSQVSAGTHEFVFRPYNTVLNFSNLNTFPPTMYQITRDSLFDRQPMIAGAPKLYSWVDSANNYYATDTLEPNGLTKLYTLDVRTYDMTDTGATYVSSNTPSQIEGRWTKKEGDIYTNVDLEDYGITLTSMGLPGNTIRVVYTSANESYGWVNINVQDEDAGIPGGTTNQVLKKNSNTDYDYSWGTINIPTKISDLTNDLPTVEMVVTLDDDTTQTYTIYGEVE